MMQLDVLSSAAVAQPSYTLHIPHTRWNNYKTDILPVVNCNSTFSVTYPIGNVKAE